MAVGLSRTSITNIERGRQKVLLHTLSEIAVVLDVAIHDLIPAGSSMKSKLEAQLPSDASPKFRRFLSDIVEKRGTTS